MVVTKIGQWSNVEDEVLKAAISKYGLNQWARVSSLLAKKTAKQCKARWQEWLDPSIKKTEWSREDDEKLLTMAKLLPTQWRTIAPIVGRTATQCLERYQKLLDEQEARESGDLGLAGPEGGESAAPTGEDVRKLRPGEVDAYAESRPARPDAVDMDEEDKEMLSEARARLANVSGKKAKRKARERQLEDSRRLAQLQKRRELKAAGINIKIVPKKGNFIDYNADVPLEREVPAGFHDTTTELDRNEREREAFDPRKQQLANKRKADQKDPDGNKRQKNEKGGSSLTASYAKMAQLQKIREAEQSSKRQSLNLPAPQVGEAELEEIVKMGMAGERAVAGTESDNMATQGLVGNYSNLVGSTPIRTPRAPQEEDVIANEIRNARARTDTQSALLGGENPEMIEGATGELSDVKAGKQRVFTPNPMATPFRQANGVGPGATPMLNAPGATPMRTPRDNFRLNEAGEMQLVAATPRDKKLREMTLRQNLRSKLESLPKPRAGDFVLEVPEEQAEIQAAEVSEEDAAERDRRNKELRDAAERAEFARQSQVVQKFLPRPSVVDVDAMLKRASDIADPIEREVETEMALLVVNDLLKFGGGQVSGAARPLENFNDEAIQRAKLELALEISATNEKEKQAFYQEADQAWKELHGTSKLPGLDGYDEDEIDEHQLMAEAFDNVQQKILDSAQQGNKIEKKMGLHLGGYQQRAKLLRQKFGDAADALEKAKMDLDSARTMQISEQAAIARRLETLRNEVTFVSRRERETQDLYRVRKDELDSLVDPVNGVH